MPCCLFPCYPCSYVTHYIFLLPACSTLYRLGSVLPFLADSASFPLHDYPFLAPSSVHSLNFLICLPLSLLISCRVYCLYSGLPSDSQFPTLLIHLIHTLLYPFLTFTLTLSFHLNCPALLHVLYFSLLL